VQSTILPEQSTFGDQDEQAQDREGDSRSNAGACVHAAETSRGHESNWPERAAAAQAIQDLTSEVVKIRLPNGSQLQNITGFLNSLDTRDYTKLVFSMHPRWVFVHPAVLTMTACAAELVHSTGGRIVGTVPYVPSLHYLIRMKLFDYVRLDTPVQIQEHEEAGRFIPITQIKTTDDLRHAIANLVPLLHAEKEVADPIKYVFSEMVRNALEHSSSPVGAFVAAQYYPETRRIAIGIADAGVGIRKHMSKFHDVPTAKDALTLALQPGITGTTSRIGGTQFNAGAGLFFTKSIASISRNMFLLYSGNTAYRLMKGQADREVKLQTNPADDPHLFPTTLPSWQGTVVGIDINVAPDVEFSELLDQIRRAYYLDVKRKKDFSPRIKFT